MATLQDLIDAVDNLQDSVTNLTVEVNVRKANLDNAVNQTKRERRSDFVSDFSYIGTANKDSLESDPVWTINRIEVFEDGTTDKKTATNVAWTDRLTVNYN